MKTLEKHQVYDLILREIKYQEKKWGKDVEQSLPGFLTIIEKELDEAKEGWMKSKKGRDCPMAEILQIAAVAFCALEKYGLSQHVYSKDDTKYGSMVDEDKLWPT